MTYQEARGVEAGCELLLNIRCVEMTNILPKPGMANESTKF
jgi:hypothetical protein